MGRQKGVKAERTAEQVIETRRGSGDGFGRVGGVKEGGLFSLCVSLLLAGHDGDANKQVIQHYHLFKYQRNTMVNKNPFLRLVSEIAYFLPLRPELFMSLPSSQIRASSDCCILQG